MYLFDTDAISQIIRKNPSVSFIKRLAAIPPEYQSTSSITVGELVYGAHKSNKPSYFIEKLNAIVWPNITVLPFDENAAQIYGRVRAELEKEGITLTEPDLRIASIALTHNLTVITGNIRHFSKVPGLKAENWFD